MTYERKPSWMLHEKWHLFYNGNIKMIQCIPMNLNDILHL